MHQEILVLGFIPLLAVFSLQSLFALPFLDFPINHSPLLFNLLPIFNLLNVLFDVILLRHPFAHLCNNIYKHMNLNLFAYHPNMPFSWLLHLTRLLAKPGSSSSPSFWHRQLLLRSIMQLKVSSFSVGLWYLPFSSDQAAIVEGRNAHHLRMWGALRESNHFERGGKGTGSQTWISKGSFSRRPSHRILAMS